VTGRRENCLLISTHDVIAGQKMVVITGLVLLHFGTNTLVNYYEKTTQARVPIYVSICSCHS